MFFLLLWGLVQLFYWPTWNAGFVTDFTGLLERLQGSPARDILVSFGFPAQQQVLNLVLYSMYHLFGTEPLGWYLVQTALHALNGVLFFQLATAFAKWQNIQHYTFPVMAATLLFLLCPYQSEPVVWRVCFNYLMSTGLIFFGLRQVLRWMEGDQTPAYWWSLGAFTLALFTFELAFTFPLLCGLLLFAKGRREKQWRTVGGKTWKLISPQILLIAFYFMLNRLSLGLWIGHHGADTHLNFDPALLAGTAWRYFAKVLGLVRYYPHDLKSAVFGFVAQPLFLISSTVLIAITGFFFFRCFRRLSPTLRVSGLLFLMGIIAILPVLNLYFNYFLLVENDRYSYLASAFWFAAFVFLLVKLPRAWSLFLFSGYLLIHLSLLRKTNRLWQESTLVYRSLMEDFRWRNDDTLYILNLPDNLRGVMIFRDYGDDAQTLLDALEYLEGRPFRGKLYEVAAYNMTRPDNGVRVETSSSDSLRITFEQWGNWWWRDGGGATDYENERYQFRNQGHHYDLIWKRHPEEDAVIIYQDGLNWKEVKR